MCFLKQQKEIQKKLSVGEEGKKRKNAMQKNKRKKKKKWLFNEWVRKHKKECLKITSSATKNRKIRLTSKKQKKKEKKIGKNRGKMVKKSGEPQVQKKKKKKKKIEVHHKS